MSLSRARLALSSGEQRSVAVDNLVSYFTARSGIPLDREIMSRSNEKHCPVERCPFKEFAMNAPLLTRRNFTTALGGIVLSFGLDQRFVWGQGVAQKADQGPVQLPGSLQTNRMLDAWLRIDAQGKVTVFTGKVELGQGIVTALAQ